MEVKAHQPIVSASRCEHPSTPEGFHPSSRLKTQLARGGSLAGAARAPSGIKPSRIPSSAPRGRGSQPREPARGLPGLRGEQDSALLAQPPALTGVPGSPRGSGAGTGTGSIPARVPGLPEPGRARSATPPPPRQRPPSRPSPPLPPLLAVRALLACQTFSLWGPGEEKPRHRPPRRSTPPDPAAAPPAPSGSGPAVPLLDLARWCKAGQAQGGRGVALRRTAAPPNSR